MVSSFQTEFYKLLKDPTYHPQVWYKAARNIFMGEELYYSYGIEYWSRIWFHEAQEQKMTEAANHLNNLFSFLMRTVAEWIFTNKTISSMTEEFRINKTLENSDNILYKIEEYKLFILFCLTS